MPHACFGYRKGTVICILQLSVLYEVSKCLLAGRYPYTVGFMDDPVHGNEQKKLLLSGRIVLQKSEVSGVVKTFRENLTKGDGAQKLHGRLKGFYTGDVEAVV